MYSFLKIWEPQNLLETSGAGLGLLDLYLYIMYSLTGVSPLIRTLCVSRGHWP